MTNNGMHYDLSNYCNYLNTSCSCNLAGVQLLIKGGFYYFGVTPLGDIGTIDSFFTIKIQDLN